jgi:hypothetical protein
VLRRDSVARGKSVTTEQQQERAFALCDVDMSSRVFLALQPPQQENKRRRPFSFLSKKHTRRVVALSSTPTTMAPTTPDAYDDRPPAARVLALPELWVIVAEHSGVVGAWRLMGVCRASREGAKEWLRTLPGLVVCGGHTTGASTSEAWKLDLGKLQWERMASLTRGRHGHACCAVRGGVVVLGGVAQGQEGRRERTASVETLGCDSVGFVLPLLSCGPLAASAAVAIDESESDQGQVLLLGGQTQDGQSSAAVHKVDLATGVCTLQPPLLSQHGVLAACTAARLADGRIVCVGKNGNASLQGTAQILEPPPPAHGSPSEASWQWRYLPGMSFGREFVGSCVLSDGRFAVFGGATGNTYTPTASCEVLTLDGDIARWDPLPPMHEARHAFACAAIGGCVIVAGGRNSITAEVYEEALGRWRRLPCSIPHDARLYLMGSALM